MFLPQYRRAKLKRFRNHRFAPDAWCCRAIHGTGGIRGGMKLHCSEAKMAIVTETVDFPTQYYSVKLKHIRNRRFLPRPYRISQPPMWGNCAATGRSNPPNGTTEIQCSNVENPLRCYAYGDDF